MKQTCELRIPDLIEEDFGRAVKCVVNDSGRVSIFQAFPFKKSKSLYLAKQTLALDVWCQLANLLKTHRRQYLLYKPVLKGKHVLFYSKKKKKIPTCYLLYLMHTLPTIKCSIVKQCLSIG